MVPEIHNEELKGLMMGNIRGLYPKSNQYKVRAIEDMANMDGVSIIALSESHLSSEILDGEIEIEGFISHRCDRINRTHGGVITYVPSSISSTRVLDFSKSKCKVVGVLLEKCETLIINVYRPPNCSEDRTSFGECLEKIQLAINDYYKAASNLRPQGK